MHAACRFVHFVSPSTELRTTCKHTQVPYVARSSLGARPVQSAFVDSLVEKELGCREAERMVHAQFKWCDGEASIDPGTEAKVGN